MKRKSSESACRVCGCTNHNACENGCSWVVVEKSSPPLCSACSGTVGDLAEAIRRSTRTLNAGGLRANVIDAAYAIGRAALRRRNARVKAEANIVDASWGSR